MNESAARDPEWLDHEYVTKIIRAAVGSAACVKKFATSPATAKGENYFSALYTLEAEYSSEDSPETRKLSLIVKSRLDSELITQLEEDFDVFAREKQYYNVIAKQMQVLMAEIGDTSRLAPCAVYVDDRILVMENLKLQAFQIRDVKCGLDRQECLIALQKLAKFHALSMLLYKKEPDMFRYHLPGNISEHPTPLHTMYSKSIESTIEFCKEKESLQRFVPKLEVFSRTIVAKMINVFSRNLTDRFHVLNHGDAWVNNILYKEDGSEVIFVDFQEGFYGSPGVDLNYFIFSSWQPAVFQHHFEDLIKVYHQSLCDVLQKLNYEQRIPTVEDVKKEIQNKSFHGLATATCLLPILINENPDLADPENFVLETAKAVQCRKAIFSNPKYAQRLEVFLKYFDDINIL